MTQGAAIGRVRRWSRAASRVTAVALGLALAGPGSALSDVRLGRDTGPGDFRVSVLSWWEIPFRTTIRQQYDYSCGSAALATLLTYQYGRPTSETEVFQAMWAAGNQAQIRKLGFSMLEMKSFLEKLGYLVVGARVSVEQLGRLNRPAIALITIGPYRHFVVIKGAHDGVIVTGDPARGLVTYRLADFGKMWNGILLLPLDSPTHQKPIFNADRDLDPWSQAPVSFGRDEQRSSIDSLTSNLPPVYQLTTQMLLAAHVGTVSGP